MSQLKPKVTTYDLTREIPGGIQLNGLSEPRSDGVNFFRQTTASKSLIEFRTNGPRFVQFEYQLYSSKSAISGQVMLDQLALGNTVFPQGKFLFNSLSGAFLEAGDHQLQVTYNCLTASCQPISQYWTKLTVIEDQRMKSSEPVGVGAEQLWLNAPKTKLQVLGVGPVTFDGVNYRRPIEKPEFILRWPSESRTLSAGFTLNAAEPFRATIMAGNQLIDVKEGDKSKEISSTFSLVEFPSSRQISVKVECLTSKEPGCASLYFPNATVLTPPENTNLALEMVGVVILMICSVFLLGLMPHQR